MGNAILPPDALEQGRSYVEKRRQGAASGLAFDIIHNAKAQTSS